VSVISDGEMSKGDYIDYVSWRLAGFSGRTPAESAFYFSDMLDTPELIDFTYRDTNFKLPVCVGEISYTGDDLVQADIAGLRAAIEKSPHQPAEAFLPAVAPGLIAMCFTNQHYAAYEDYVFALADAMAVEYCAIVDAGFLLQIDDPDLPDGWNCLPEITVPEYRKYATMRVDALNHALRGIPREKIRLHVCWGSHHGPHHDDIPLRDIIDLIFRVNAGSYSIEASNPCHEHEWRVFEDVKLPEGATLIPGVVGHCTDFIEHPDLVAERLVRYARLVGRENVLAGTDCGLGTRVGHPSIVWAKFNAMAEGARRATRQLWGRA
jgi:5-methyltetrahydropteroyltriglutamate--homocysteine methyltransferase